jgi:uncharacterized membrane protein YagU involved in acid resistance
MNVSRANFSFEKVWKGALAGFLGTAPMTASMLLIWKFLPAQEKYALPPRQITGEVAERLDIDDRLSEYTLTAATLASHFGYGAASGALYAFTANKIPIHPGIKGALAGLILWAASYLGWIPAAKLLPPATRHPWRRNLMMIFAHFVWGATMGMVFKKLEPEKRYLELE